MFNSAFKRAALCLLLSASLATAAEVVGYQDWQIRSGTPGNPGTGFLRTWVDPATGTIKCETASGAACYFSSTGGGGGGSIGGSGTANALAVFTDGTTLGSSDISDVAGTITVTGNVGVSVSVSAGANLLANGFVGSVGGYNVNGVTVIDALQNGTLTGSFSAHGITSVGGFSASGNVVSSAGFVKAYQGYYEGGTQFLDTSLNLLNIGGLTMSGGILGPSQYTSLSTNFKIQSDNIYFNRATSGTVQGATFLVGGSLLVPGAYTLASDTSGNLAIASGSTGTLTSIYRFGPTGSLAMNGTLTATNAVISSNLQVAASGIFNGPVEMTALTAGSGGAVVCVNAGYLYAGGCGSGGSGIAGSGTTGALAVFTSSSSVGNSDISDVAGTITVTGNVGVSASVSASANLLAGGFVGSVGGYNVNGVTVIDALQNGTLAGSFSAHGITSVGGFSASGNVTASAGYVKASAGFYEGGTQFLDTSLDLINIASLTIAGGGGIVGAQEYLSNTTNFKIQSDNIYFNRATSGTVQGITMLVAGSAIAQGAFTFGSDASGNLGISAGNSSSTPEVAYLDRFGTLTLTGGLNSSAANVSGAVYMPGLGAGSGTLSTVCVGAGGLLYSGGCGGTSSAVTSAAALQAAICALPAAGGSVTIGANITLTANINTSSCSTPPASVQVLKTKGLTITSAGFMVLDSFPLATGSESYGGDSHSIACVDPVPTQCSSSLRPIDQPTVFLGRSDSGPGGIGGWGTPQQTDAAVIISNATSDSFGPTSALARNALSVYSQYGGSNGTVGGITIQSVYNGNTTNKGAGAVTALVQTDSTTGGSNAGFFGLWGGCMVGGPAGCSGLDVEVNTTAAAAANLVGVIVNEVSSVGNLHNVYGILQQLNYPTVLGTATDVVTSNSPTITSASGGFSGCVPGINVSIIGSGVFKVASCTSAYSIVMTGTVPTVFTGQTAYLGVNPATGYLAQENSGHNLGGFLMRNIGGARDFYSMLISDANANGNVIQYMNQPASCPSSCTGTGYSNILEFWRGFSGPSATVAIQNQTAVETGRIVSDMTSGGSYGQGFIDIYANVGQVTTKVSRFDVSGLSMSGSFGLNALGGTVTGLYGTFNGTASNTLQVPYGGAIIGGALQVGSTALVSGLLTANGGISSTLETSSNGFYTPSTGTTAVNVPNGTVSTKNLLVNGSAYNALLVSSGGAVINGALLVGGNILGTGTVQFNSLPASSSGSHALCLYGASVTVSATSTCP